MSDTPTVMTREALYTLVWRRPMRDIAPTLNLSDVGLAKLCKRHNIPRPKPGHWLKSDHDRLIKQPPLPDVGAGSRITIELPGQKRQTEPPPPAAESLPPISTKKATHALIKQCRDYFKGAAVNDYGRLASEHRKDADVSRKAMPRALGILNTLLHTIEALGHTATFNQKERSIELWIDGEQMCLAINETATRSDRELTPKQKAHKAQYGYIYGKRWDYTPSGKLILTVNAFGLYGTRSSWSDKKRSQLEDDLPTVMSGILVCGARLKERRTEDMERKRRHKIYQRRQARMAYADKLRKQRIQSIGQMVTGLERAQAIRTCLAEGSSSLTEDTGIH